MGIIVDITSEVTDIVKQIVQKCWRIWELRH